MTTVLQKQLDTYASSVAGVNGGGTRVARIADDLIDLGLRLHDAVKDSVRRWHADISSGVVAYDDREAEQFMSLYRTLDLAFDRIASLVGQTIANGGMVEAGERFDRERMYLKATLSIAPDKVRRAAGQVAAGQVKPAAEVRRELLRRLQPWATLFRPCRGWSECGLLREPVGRDANRTGCGNGRSTPR